MLEVPTIADPYRHASVEALRKALKLMVLVREPYFRRALRLGTAAAVEHRNLPLLADAATVIDVGAHQGQFALLARHRYPNAQLHCFEPLPAPRAKLTRLFANDDQVVIHPLAAAQGSGAASMHVSKADDSSSLLPIGERYVASFPGTEEGSRIDVEQARIDDVLAERRIANPVLVKVDVQGTELEALRGAVKTLAGVDQLLVEVSFMELYHGQTLAGGIVSFLYERGFELTGCFNLKGNRIGQCIQADFLFDRP